MTKLICRGCLLDTDTAVVLGSPGASSQPIGPAHSSMAPPHPREGVSSQVFCAPRRHTIELPLSDDPVEELVLRWNLFLKMKASEGSYFDPLIFQKERLAL